MTPVRSEGMTPELTLNRDGATRHVLLIWRWAIKIPALWSWKHVLWGLLANMQERVFWRAHLPYGERLCPVLLSDALGFLLVMPRARVMTDAEFKAFDYEAFVFTEDGNWKIPAEAKSDSFGWINGSVVAIDYGS